MGDAEWSVYDPGFLSLLRYRELGLSRCKGEQAGNMFHAVGRGLDEEMLGRYFQTHMADSSPPKRGLLRVAWAFKLSDL